MEWSAVGGVGWGGVEWVEWGEVGELGGVGWSAMECSVSSRLVSSYAAQRCDAIRCGDESG